jgi:inhibitor of KinA sporulation pathway (predicted exonuclease)
MVGLLEVEVVLTVVEVATSLSELDVVVVVAVVVDGAAVVVVDAFSSASISFSEPSLTSPFSVTACDVEE